MITLLSADMIRILLLVYEAASQSICWWLFPTKSSFSGKIYVKNFSLTVGFKMCGFLSAVMDL